MMNKKILLFKIYKRTINTEMLQKVMTKMSENVTLQKTKTVNNHDFLEKMNKLKEKVEIKTETKKFETIQENLNESIKIMKELRSNFSIIKEKSVQIEIKIQKENEVLQENKLDTLNNNFKNIREINDSKNSLNEINKDIMDKSEIVINQINNVKKTIFDIEWLQPFLDFMHNNSTLVLTIGSSLIIGGMWYMNNVGIINIGSLLSRLGISIFSSNPARLSQSVAAPSVYSRPRPEPVVDPEVEARIARLESRGFFRQLGAKVLELLDVMIEKFKDKRQSYK